MNSRFDRAAPDHQVLALRYAESGPERMRKDNFFPGQDLHDGPMPLDYFIWVIRGGQRTILVDTGFAQDAARRRGRVLLRHPVEALKAIGLDPADVPDVVITHLHYDHAGTLPSFPGATFHVQDKEMAYATGRSMGFDGLRAAFDVENVAEAVRLVHAGQVRFHDGDAEIAPGVSVHWIGGHTGGLQVVRVSTARGPLVLASDAFHFDEHRARRVPFPLVYNVGDMLDGYDRCAVLAGGDDGRLVPGHDPAVLQHWPALDPRIPDVVRLDLRPRADDR